jgi:hypothetical protein
MILSKLAKMAGLYEAIPDELWGCDLGPLAILFIERISSHYFSCYKVTWPEKKRSPEDLDRGPMREIVRHIKSEKVYLAKATFDECLDRSRCVIDWYKGIKK